MSNTSAKNAPAERRKTKRRPILDTFSLFVVVPQKGVHRLPLHDISEDGIGFDLDTEGESFSEFPMESGSTLELHVYLNQSLYLPIVIEAVRIEERENVRRIGGRFSGKNTKNYKALVAFVQMLDELPDVARIARA